jgi:hypothetical protein
MSFRPSIAAATAMAMAMATELVAIVRFKAGGSASAIARLVLPLSRKTKVSG